MYKIVIDISDHDGILFENTTKLAQVIDSSGLSTVYILGIIAVLVLLPQSFFFSNKFAYGGGVGVEGDWNYQ